MSPVSIMCNSNMSSLLFSQNLVLFRKTLSSFVTLFLHFLYFFCTSSVLIFCTFLTPFSTFFTLSALFFTFLHLFYIFCVSLAFFPNLFHTSSVSLMYLFYTFSISTTSLSHLFCINFAFLMHFSASLLTIASLLHFRTIPTPLSYLFRICSAPFCIVSAHLP